MTWTETTNPWARREARTPQPTEEQLAEAALEVERKEQNRLAQRAKLKEQIEAAKQCEARAGELRLAMDTLDTEIANLQTLMQGHESELSAIDDPAEQVGILAAQEKLAAELSLKRRQRAAIGQNYLEAAKDSPSLYTGELFKLGRADLLADLDIARQNSELTRNRIETLQENRDRFSQLQYNARLEALNRELQRCTENESRASRAVLDE